MVEVFNNTSQYLFTQKYKSSSSEEYKLRVSPRLFPDLFAAMITNSINCHACKNVETDSVNSGGCLSADGGHGCSSAKNMFLYKDKTMLPITIATGRAGCLNQLLVGLARLRTGRGAAQSRLGFTNEGSRTHRVSDLHTSYLSHTSCHPVRPHEQPGGQL